ncbi:MAG: AIR synthase family protein [Candidatus Freyarchaeota archaeon]|nr:AIR synthase family protein [Candidatus Jordarchaeia archaeon]
MVLPIGKVSIDVLKRIVFPCGGAKSKRVVLGPAVGEDAAVIDAGDRFLVVASDPITGASKDVGWYAVNVNANDVAVRGARPLFLTLTVLLPKGADEGLLEEVMRGADSAAKELGVSIVGGHTEVTPYLEQPIVCGTMIGEAERGKIVTTGGARPGDLIVVTKHAGLEGASILAWERYNELLSVVGRETLEMAKKFSRELSVVREALALNEKCKVTAMHDPTEGGVIGGLIELSIASKVGFRIEEWKIPVAEETRRICEELSINPFRLISSGMLLATVEKEDIEAAAEVLNGLGVQWSIIGEVTEKGRVMVRDGKTVEVEDEIVEELWEALRKPIVRR